MLLGFLSIDFDRLADSPSKFQFGVIMMIALAWNGEKGELAGELDHASFFLFLGLKFQPDSIWSSLKGILLLLRRGRECFSIGALWEGYVRVCL